MLMLKIVGAIAALAVGVWLGLPGRFEQTPEEIERTMATGAGRRRKVKRHFTPFAWLSRKANVRREAPRRRGGRFHLETPEDR
jgi:hypothetical protein